jgi:HSP20 family protein
MLTRFDPFRDFDRLVEQLSPVRGAHLNAMPLDIARGHDGYVVEADLPGIEPSSIDLSVEGNVLTIRAERASSKLDDMEVLASERPTGTFVRQLSVGDGFDMERIEADYNNGVLCVRLPVAEAAKPRKIEVAVGRSDRATPIGAPS